MATEIIVEYNDGSEEVYNSIKEAREGILETVTGCDFATMVDSVEVFKNKKFVRSLGCQWNVTLVELKEK